MRTQVQFLASLSGLRIQRCRELWCRRQMWLRSHIAVSVTVASGSSSDLTPRLGTFMCHGCSPEEKKKKNVTHASSVQHSFSSRLRSIKEKGEEFPCGSVWFSGLRIQCHHCSGLSCCCGAGFLGPHPHHMEVPRLGVELEL